MRFFLICFILFCIGMGYMFRDQRMADCKDGTVSYSKSRSGTCSKHGGVAQWR